MLLWRLAFRNMQGHLHDYRAYLGSTALSVAVFFLYQTLLDNADVHLTNSNQVSGLASCGVVIAMFALVFTYYAHGSFLRTRSSEFGMLKLLGMTSRQIAWVVMGELAALALLSIIIGLAVGTLLEKFFFLLATVPLSLPQVPPMVWQLRPYIVTLASFVCIFAAMSIMSGIKVSFQSIYKLLKASRTAKKPPRLSPLRATLASVFLLSSWVIALRTSLSVPAIFSILILATVGTYLSFSQGLVALLRFMQHSRTFYYNGLRMVGVGQMIYRARDHARLLAMASIMGSIVLIALGSIFAVYARADSVSRQNWPFDISYMVQAGTPNREPLVRQLLQQHGHAVSRAWTVTGLSVHSTDGTAYFIFSTNAFDRLAAALGNRQTLHLNDGQAVFDYPWVGAQVATDTSRPKLLPHVHIMTDTAPIRLAITQAITLRVTDELYLMGQYLIVNQSTFHRLLQSQPLSARTLVYAFDIHDWKGSLSTVTDIQRRLAALPESNAADFTSVVAQYQEIVAVTGSVLFAGLFIALVFLFGIGSMQYFRIMTELKDDRRQFQALWRIGVSTEMNWKLTAVQILAVFLAPCLMAELNSLFAFILLSHILAVSVWRPALIVTGIYLAVMLFFCMIAIASQGRSRLWQMTRDAR